MVELRQRYIYDVVLVRDVKSISLSSSKEGLQKDLPKPKHEVYLRGVRPVPPCVLTEGPRRGTNFGGCLATAKPNFGQPESVSLLT